MKTYLIKYNINKKYNFSDNFKFFLENFYEKVKWMNYTQYITLSIMLHTKSGKRHLMHEIYIQGGN